MSVLIVSKTQMNYGNICIGGLDLSNGENIRLFDSKGNCFKKNTAYNIGDIWDIDYKKKVNSKPPHIEDALIYNSKFIKKIPDIRSFLLKQITPWRGSPGNIFEGKLNYIDTDSAYINAKTGLPSGSVGFWITSIQLTRDDFDTKVKFRIRKIPEFNFRIKYVGLEEPLSQIEPGTLLRLSLARWFDQNGKTEDRCYLQISGWYL